MSAGLSVLENVQVAGIAAVTEGVLLQPTLYWKNAAAQKLPFTLDPRLLYRGTAASVLNETQVLYFVSISSRASLHFTSLRSCIQMMVMQFAFTRMFQRLWGQSAGQASAAQLLVTATAGGCASAFLSAPIELVMIQQQRFGRSFPHTLASVVRTHGLGSAGLMRGLGPTVARDGVYVNGLLGITPVVQRLLLKRGASRNSASVGGSLVGGAICSLASHPSDMVKTCMQGDLTQVMSCTLLLSHLPMLVCRHATEQLYRLCVCYGQMAD